MTENHEGFFVPQVDADKCIDCGLCLRACPALNEKRQNSTEPECYAAQADDKIRAVSSSGGVFTPLAEAIIDRGGYVCGAAFREDWTVHHIIIDNKVDLAKLRGSKYVQSDTEDCYKRIKSLLREGKWVLFSGTPCQVAGLYSYLGKEYDTLVTVDIFCHGAPSPGVWKRYLRENYRHKDIANINFRDKTAIGWSCSHVTVTLKDGTRNVCNNYTKWFHSSVILRKSCANCKFNKLPRPADITLGDWWGISKVNPALNDGKGLSNVLINSDKGRALYTSVSLASSTPIQLPGDYNNSFIRYGLEPHPEREVFLSDNLALNTTRRMGADIKKHTFDVCLVTTFFADNYGAILVAYAAYKILESLGYRVLMQNAPTCIWGGGVNETNLILPYAFAWRHYPYISSHYSDMDELASLNDNCSAFVVGSDQLFNPALNLDATAYLQYVRKDRLKIAFGTSIGHERYVCNPERLLKNKILLQRFDHISLREMPRNVVENLLELNAVEIIDPTLITPVEEYHKLADSSPSEPKDKPYLLAYILDPTPAKDRAILYIAERLNLEVIHIADLHKRRNNRKTRTPYPSILPVIKDYIPEEFCQLYKHSAFVVTDSYHGTCFSVIFRKRFVSFVNSVRGRVRYKMFDEFGLSNRIYADLSAVYKTNKWMDSVDYEKVEIVIQKKAAFAREWLAEALSSLRQERKGKHVVRKDDNIIKPIGLRRRLSRRIARPVRDFFRAFRKKLFTS